VAPLNAGRVLRAFRRRPVDHANNAAPQRGLRHNHFDGICRGAKKIHDLGHVLDARQQVDRVALPHGDIKGVSGAHGQRVADRELLQILIVAVGPDETRARGLIERQAEFHLRHRIHDRLVQVLDRLDEVALADNDISVFRDFECDGVKIH